MLTFKVRFVLLAFAVALAGCNHMMVHNGRVHLEDSPQIQELAGIYDGSVKLYSASSADERVVLDHATLTLSLDKSGLVLLELTPSTLEPNCTLRFTRVESIGGLRTRLRGQFSTEMRFLVDHAACPGLLEQSAAQLVVDPNRNGKSLAMLKVVSKSLPGGSFWESDSSVYYRGDFAKR